MNDRIPPLSQFIYDELVERGWKTVDVMRRWQELPANEPFRTRYYAICLLSLNLSMLASPDRVIWHEETLRQVATAFNVSVSFLRSLEQSWLDHPEKWGDTWECPLDAISRDPSDFVP